MKETQFKQAVDVTISNNDTIKEMKTDVSQLKTDVSQLREEMNTRFNGVESELHRQGLIQEEMQKDLRTIAQAVTPLLKNSAKTRTIEEQLGDQKDQIEVTQISLRDHLADPFAHRPA